MVTDRLDATRATRMARLGGLLYLVIIVIGAAGEAVVRGRVVVPGNPAATVANLQSMEWLWRLGVAGEVVLLLSATALAVILYALFRAVSEVLALAAVVFNLMCIAIEGVAAVSLASALFPVTNAAMRELPAEQIGAMAMTAIRAHTLGFGIALIFFGVECVIVGYLIVRSTFMPRWIGVLMQIAGVCYLVNSFALLLSPPLSSRLFPAILLPSLIGELSFAVWLAVKGVRSEQWNRHAALRTQHA